LRSRKLYTKILLRQILQIVVKDACSQNFLS
jgi:hypothetical protein